MNTENKSAIIIGATLSGLIAAKTIAELFEAVIIVEQGSEQSLSQRALQYVRTLSNQPGVQVLFNSRVSGFLTNTAGHITGATIQEDGCSLEKLNVDVIIDAADISSHNPLCLQYPKYDAVPYTEKQIVISAPCTQTVTIKSYHYHQSSSLPGGLFVIGGAVTNIGQLAAQEDKLASVQAIILKQYLCTKRDNIHFQKNIARIVSIVTREYINLARQAMQLERRLETRPAFASI